MLRSKDEHNGVTLGEINRLRLFFHFNDFFEQKNLQISKFFCIFVSDFGEARNETEKQGTDCRATTPGDKKKSKP